MRWFKALVVTFSTYTRFPLPRVDWDEEVMPLAIGYLPLVGLTVGAAVWAWWLFCRYFELSAVLFAALATVLPLLVTGGIHMDGYCDSCDALAAWQGREERLKILQDPHVGAFALIHFGAYQLITFGLFYELYVRGSLVSVVPLYVLSRCFAIFSALTLPNARREGMLAAFTQKTDRLAVTLLLLIFSLSGLWWWLCLSPVGGLIGLILCLPLTFWYRHLARQKFGGATGDTTGFHLQLLELVLLAGLVLGNSVAGR